MTRLSVAGRRGRKALRWGADRLGLGADGPVGIGAGAVGGALRHLRPPPRPDLATALMGRGSDPVLDFMADPRVAGLEDAAIDRLALRQRHMALAWAAVSLILLLTALLFGGLHALPPLVCGLAVLLPALRADWTAWRLSNRRADPVIRYLRRLPFVLWRRRCD